MAALYRAPEGMLMSGLSRFLLVSNGNVTGIVDRLVSEGLVTRARRNGDRRTSMVTPRPSWSSTNSATSASITCWWRDHRDGMVLLQSGCLCCTLRGDLVAALENCCATSTTAASSFRRVILETTGLADPAPVLQTAMAHPYLVMRYRLDGVVTVVDAVNGAATLDAHLEAVKQVAVADRIVLTKTDLIDTPERAPRQAALVARLRALNPAAPDPRCGRRRSRCRRDCSTAVSTTRSRRFRT